MLCGAWRAVSGLHWSVLCFPHAIAPVVAKAAHHPTEERFWAGAGPQCPPQQVVGCSTVDFDGQMAALSKASTEGDSAENIPTKAFHA